MTESDQTGPDQTTSVVTSRADEPEPWQIRVIMTLAVLALVHTVVIAVWMAPTSAARQGLGGSSLTSYVNPYFNQSWTTLAPSSQSVDESFQVRARVRNGGKEAPTVTAWADVTGEDLSAGLHRPIQPRSRMAARRLATNINATAAALSDDARTAIGKNQRRASSVVNKLTKTKVPREQIRAYTQTEKMSISFASLYAHARWGNGVESVQIRIGRRDVPPRAGRHRIADTKFGWTTIGWRPQFRGSTDARLAFNDYVQQ